MIHTFISNISAQYLSLPVSSQILWAFLGPWGALYVLYIIGIQYERGGLWYCVIPVTLMALILDVILNYTTLAILTMDFPRSGEFTFSQRLERLVKYTDWRGSLARPVARALDAWEPLKHKHILNR